MATTGNKRELRRNLTVWQAVGMSIALMAPSMAANINPQQTATTVGRAVPLSFLLASIAILLVSYGFVRLCQYYQHAGSVYAFVGSTLGPRTGVVSGLCLLATYTFYGVVTSSAFGILGSSFLEQIGVWHSPSRWAPFLLAAIALVGALWLTIIPARRGTTTLLVIEGATVFLILLVSAVVLVRLLAHSVPDGGTQSFTLDVFAPQAGTSASLLFLGIVFGFLSFAGFEASATLGEETAHPHRDIPRAILGTAIFGGLYFTVVTAIEMMGFGSGSDGVKKFVASGSLAGDLGTTYVGAWAGDLVSLGAAISAFGCCLACTVGAARMLFAMNRDLVGTTGLSKVTRHYTPGRAATLVIALMIVIYIVSISLGGATATNTFAWSGTIGTLLILVAYVLTTVGSIRLVFVQRKMRVPMWQVVIPLAALVMLVYTLYRNVIPFPTSGAAMWFPIVSGAIVVAAIIAVLAAPQAASRLGANLAAEEGIMTRHEPAGVQADAAVDVAHG